MTWFEAVVDLLGDIAQLVPVGVRIATQISVGESGIRVTVTVHPPGTTPKSVTVWRPLCENQNR